MSGLLLNMASQQLSAAIFNCPLMECSARASQYQWMSPNPLVIKGDNASLDGTRAGGGAGSGIP
ncbi:MAG: hypothetical protein R2932_54570 [Caldilineaceae bacterium]